MYLKMVFKNDNNCLAFFILVNFNLKFHRVFRFELSIVILFPPTLWIKETLISVDDFFEHYISSMTQHDIMIF